MPTQSGARGCATGCVISHNSKKLLTNTVDFVALFCFNGYVVFVHSLFLVGFESPEDQFFVQS